MTCTNTYSAGGCKLLSAIVQAQIMFKIPPPNGLVGSRSKAALGKSWKRNPVCDVLILQTHLGLN